jgi:hypothetical protein
MTVFAPIVMLCVPTRTAFSDMIAFGSILQGGLTGTLMVDGLRTLARLLDIFTRIDVAGNRNTRRVDMQLVVRNQDGLSLPGLTKIG